SGASGPRSRLNRQERCFKNRATRSAKSSGGFQNNQGGKSVEPGPASFFSAAQLTIKPEPALGADSDRVDVGDTTKLEQDFARLESTLTDAEALLSSVAEDLQVHINAVDNTIKAELAGTAPMIPEAITAESDTAQGATD